MPCASGIFFDDFGRCGVYHLSTTFMLRNFFKTAVRNLLQSKGHSLINITGLAVGMAVAILIGLWIYDEVSFDKQFTNEPHIAQVIQNLVEDPREDRIV
jgi:hypothetical protein